MAPYPAVAVSSGGLAGGLAPGGALQCLVRWCAAPRLPARPRFARHVDSPQEPYGRPYMLHTTYSNVPGASFEGQAVR